ncbi:hypothetical protein Hanom_Chr12g01093111 [Helianthus anomalus]
MFLHPSIISQSILMASPSKPSSRPSASSMEEEVEHIEVDKALPVLKWNAPAFRNFMTTVQMPEACGASYPQD